MAKRNNNNSGLTPAEKLEVKRMIEEAVVPLSSSIAELTKAVTALVASQNQKPAQTLPTMAELFQFQMIKSMIN